MARTTRTNRATGIGSLLVLCTAVLIGACGGSATGEQAPTLDNINDAPRDFIGQRVTVAGEVDKVYDDRSLKIEDDDLLMDDELLVLSASPLRVDGRKPSDGDEVVVTGDIQQFVRADIEREFGSDLSGELEIEWEGRPVLIASSLRARPE